MYCIKTILLENTKLPIFQQIWQTAFRSMMMDQKQQEQEDDCVECKSKLILDTRARYEVARDGKQTRLGMFNNLTWPHLE